MDNEGFRNLVNSGNLGSDNFSTKEIARNAVEREFKLKRRRKGGYMDSSDEDEAGSTIHRGNKKTEKTQGEKNVKSKSYESSGYRDRARERREGIVNKDYDASIDTSAKAIVDEEMSKFLGGDESHTHLVKGLDISLANKVRREMEATPNEVSSDYQPLPVVSTLRRTISYDSNMSVEQAITIINRANSSLSAQPDLQNLVRYLKVAFADNVTSKAVRIGFQPSSNVSASGLQIQRSNLSFSINDNLYDRSKLWETPIESTMSKTQFEQLRKNESSCLTPFDRSFISRLKSILSNSKKLKIHPKKKKPIKRRELITSGPNHMNTTSTKTQTSSAIDRENNSDDDIFDDVGEYKGFSSDTYKKPREDQGDGGKVSIFDSLFTDDTTSINNSIRQNTTKLEVKSPPRKVIDRDILGLTHNEKGRSYKGLSLSHCEGDYGEDMDIDFDGSLDESTDLKRKKKQTHTPQEVSK